MKVGVNIQRIQLLVQAVINRVSVSPPLFMVIVSFVLLLDLFERTIWEFSSYDAFTSDFV